MPRVTKAVARKAYPQAGIAKGDTYYSWSFYRSGVIRSKTPPRPSQLCNNKLSGALAAMEDLDDAIDKATCPEDVVEAINTAVDSLHEVADEYDEAISNMEQVFQGGSPQIEEHEEKKEAIEACVSELEDASSEIENLDASEYSGVEDDTFEALTEEQQTAMMDAVRDIINAVGLDV